MSIFSNIVKSITDWLKSDLANYLLSLVNFLADNGGKLLVNAALAAVAAAEAKGGTGSEKFQAAKESVVATLNNNGVSFVMSAVHFAIESAVAKMNQAK